MARKNPVSVTEVGVGTRLRSVRERSHIPQTQFALLREIGRERLASYEAGRVPLPFRIGEKVCDRWGINPFWLADGKDPQLDRHFFSVIEGTIKKSCSFRDAVKMASSETRAAIAKGAKKATAMPSAGIVVMRSTGVIPGETVEPGAYFDPSVVRVAVDRRELDPFGRRECIERFGTVCQVCGMQFEKVYGKIGSDFIEIHHLFPEASEQDNVDPAANLVPICSNCHRMIHRRSPMLSVQELKDILIRNCWRPAR